MSEFKPGDRVVWSGKEVELLERDEGRWSVRYAGAIHHNVRPSELTPADPVPDAAVMLVRELCAATCRGHDDLVASLFNDGDFDESPTFVTFVEYVRTYPPLTVGRVHEVLSNNYSNCSEVTAINVHAALTERKA